MCLFFHKFLYLSFVHKICINCGRMEFNCGWDKINYWWVNWLTHEVNDVFDAYSITNPQPKTVEGFYIEAKQYDDEALTQRENRKKYQDRNKEIEKLAMQKARERSR